jgi:toxin-antitoxin system PIN domain toxin
MSRAPRLLLDVNVWIALLDDNHFFNAQARALFARSHLRIATCAMTENGVMRVLNAPRYSAAVAPGFEAVRKKLAYICTRIDHEFWPDDVSVRDPDRFDFNYLLGHNQLTDAYLLALAVAHDGSLATFDQAVALRAVHGAQARHLRVLSASTV